MKEKWNNRYSSEEYFFGKEPNEFFKKEIDKLIPGKALFIGEGEGRNSVYAAKLGWDIDAIDISDVAMKKAEKFAQESKVKLNYIVDDAINYSYKDQEYNSVIIIYFHVQKDQRKEFEQKIIKSLKPNGKIILLVYDEEHLKNDNGGPSHQDLLYNLSEIAENYIDLEFNTFAKEHISRIKKGRNQESTVIKFVGTKI